MPTAAEVNEETGRKRDRAARDSANRAQIEEMRKRTDELYAFATGKADEVASLVLERKGINEQVKALFDEVEAEGFDRKAFKDMLKLRIMDVDQRNTYEASRRQLSKAFGFDSGEQLDMLDPVLKPLPVEAQSDILDEQDMTDERAAQIAEHIGKHGTSPKH